LYLQNVLGRTALETGLAVLPGSLAMGLAGPLIGRIYDRRGTQILLIPGAIITSVVLWFYSTVGTDTSFVLLVVAQTVLSIGLALSFTPLFTASLGSLAPRFYSYGSAVVGTVQQVAGAAGIALLVTVMAGVSAASGGGVEGDAAGARMAFMIAAIVSLPLIVGAFLIRKPADIIEGAAPMAH
jgi:DHA2 family lincomycin resistance protein-like MFS transporter